MKKTGPVFLFLLSLYIPLSTFAQRPPQWLMPLYFQDANGDRDTVYFGYDPEASWSCVDLDDFLGEVWTTIDTSKFNVYEWAYPCDVGGSFSELHTKTVRKVDIRNDFIGTYLGFCKGKLPICMKWVDSLLYAPSCPFPDLSPRPRARIELSCYDGDGAYYNCQYNDGPPLSLTDYPAPEIPYPIMDSMFFDGSGLYPPSVCILTTTLSLVAHNYVYDALENIIPGNVKVYPNPFTNEITIESSLPGGMEITILTTIGHVLYRYAGNGNLFSLSLNGLNSGIYFLVLRSDQFVYTQKITKTE
jgi:hypothetical protein